MREDDGRPHGVCQGLLALRCGERYRDSAETWVVTAPVPGMQAGDVELDCEGDTITIHARPKGFPHAPKDYLLYEWHAGSYHRRIELPAVEANACDASIAAGMLVIRIQKPEWEKVVNIPRAGGRGEPGRG